MKEIVIVGGGIAGMEAAWRLASLNYKITLIEKNNYPGGHVANWDRLFPNKRPADEVIDYLKNKIQHENITVLSNTEITKVEKSANNTFSLQLSTGKNITSDALLLTVGYDLFDARRKEEYGYGIYENVITSAELEKMFREKNAVVTSTGAVPKRVGIIHCVGSRDEKCGNMYCSKVCCVTGVKQASEIKELYPETEVFNFYMDLRMFSRNFEQLYLEAQKNGVHFIRGRLSEASETQNGGVMLKVDDTLAGKPIKMTVDLLVLMIGYEPPKAANSLIGMLNLAKNNDHFIGIKDEHLAENLTNEKGVFVAGACTGAKSINETMADARSAAFELDRYLRQ